jgi:hypothetical protein
MEVMALMKGDASKVPNLRSRLQGFVKSYNLNNPAIMVEIEKFLEDNLFVPDDLIELLEELDPITMVQANFKAKVPSILNFVTTHVGSDEGFVTLLVEKLSDLFGSIVSELRDGFEEESQVQLFVKENVNVALGQLAGDRAKLI